MSFVPLQLYACCPAGLRILHSFNATPALFESPAARALISKNLCKNKNAPKMPQRPCFPRQALGDVYRGLSDFEVGSLQSRVLRGSDALQVAGEQSCAMSGSLKSPEDARSPYMGCGLRSLLARVWESQLAKMSCKTCRLTNKQPCTRHKSCLSCTRCMQQELSLLVDA